jgi:hypothetical protein
LNLAGGTLVEPVKQILLTIKTYFDVRNH